MGRPERVILMPAQNGYPILHVVFGFGSALFLMLSVLALLGKDGVLIPPLLTIGIALYGPLATFVLACIAAVATNLKTAACAFICWASSVALFVVVMYDICRGWQAG